MTQLWFRDCAGIITQWHITCCVWQDDKKNFLPTLGPLKRMHLYGQPLKVSLRNNNTPLLKMGASTHCFFMLFPAVVVRCHSNACIADPGFLGNNHFGDRRHVDNICPPAAKHQAFRTGTETGSLDGDHGSLWVALDPQLLRNIHENLRGQKKCRDWDWDQIYPIFEATGMQQGHPPYSWHLGQTTPCSILVAPLDTPLWLLNEINIVWSRVCVFRSKSYNSPWHLCSGKCG